LINFAAKSAEVRSGLSEGDAAIIHPLDTAKDAAAVAVNL
jgi:hypothetical protein